MIHFIWNIDCSSDASPSRRSDWLLTFPRAFVIGYRRINLTPTRKPESHQSAPLHSLRFRPFLGTVRALHTTIIKGYRVFFATHSNSGLAFRSRLQLPKPFYSVRRATIDLSSFDCLPCDSDT